MANRHLVRLERVDQSSHHHELRHENAHHLLHFHFLEGTKPASARLHVQRAPNAVLLALVDVLAVGQRGEGLRGDILECLCAADIACVRVDEQQRLDFGHTCDDAADRDELAQMRATNVANSIANIALQWLEVEIAGDASDEGRR